MNRYLIEVQPLPSTISLLVLAVLELNIRFHSKSKWPRLTKKANSTVGKRKSKIPPALEVLSEPVQVTYITSSLIHINTHPITYSFLTNYHVSIAIHDDCQSIDKDSNKFNYTLKSTSGLSQFTQFNSASITCISHPEKVHYYSHVQTGDRRHDTHFILI